MEAAALADRTPSLPCLHLARRSKPDADCMEQFGHGCKETSKTDAPSIGAAGDSDSRIALRRAEAGVRGRLFSRNVSGAGWRGSAQSGRQLRGTVLRH